MHEPLNPELVLELDVKRAETVATDIRAIELVSLDGAPLPAFAPGAHLLVQAPTGATRRYSLCNPPSESSHYLIAVKREAAGRGGSLSIVDRIEVGDRLYASLPRNEFELKATAPSFLLIAGGIGITPIRSMVHHLAQAAGKPFKLLYLTRQRDMTAFADELAHAPFRDQVVIHHDYGDPGRAFDLWPLLEKPRGVHLYCCGPRSLLEAVRDMTGHWPTSAVHFEDFGEAQPAPVGRDTAFTVRIGAGGPPIEVPAHLSILEALRAHGHRLPSSCESGTCGTCRMKLLAGDPDHRDLVLTDAERRHAIMICVSRARSRELTLEPSATRAVSEERDG